MSFCWHKWSRWQKDVYRTGEVKDKVVMYEMKQLRFCFKCGKWTKKNIKGVL